METSDLDEGDWDGLEGTICSERDFCCGSRKVDEVNDGGWFWTDEVTGGPIELSE